MSRLSWTNYGVSSGENVTQLLEYVTFAFPKLPVLVTPNVQFSCATPAVSIHKCIRLQTMNCLLREVCLFVCLLNFPERYPIKLCNYNVFLIVS